MIPKTTFKYKKNTFIKAQHKLLTRTLIHISKYYLNTPIDGRNLLAVLFIKQDLNSIRQLQKFHNCAAIGVDVVHRKYYKIYILSFTFLNNLLK